MSPTDTPTGTTTGIPDGAPPGTAVAPAVQAVGRRPVDVERRPWESTAVVVVFTALYSVLGVWLVVRLHVVDADALDRLSRALVVVHGDPPGLGAVGFDRAPLSVLLLAPFAAIPALARTLVAVPVASALFAALTLMFLHTMMRRAQLGWGLRVAILATLGLNPLLVASVATGAADVLWWAGALGALGALFAWYVTADVRFILLAGLGFAVAALTGYASLTWVVTSVVVVVVILARLGADGREIEGTAVGLASPALYAVALWTGLNLVLLGDGFHWVTAAARSVPGGAAVTLDDQLRGTIEVVLYGAPLALVVLPALVYAGIARGNAFALALASLLAVTILTPGVAAALGASASPVVLADAVPVLLVAVVGGLWLARSSTSRRTPVSAGLAVLLVISIPWTFAAMDRVERQGLERAVHDAIVTGEPQEGARSPDGSIVGYDDELDMARFIRDRVPDGARILTDDAATHAVLLLTGSPDRFVDRAGESGPAWSRAAGNPAARADYLLLSVEPGGDLLSRLYPAAAQGTDPALPLVHANRGYSLVEVPAGYVRDDSARSGLDLDRLIHEQESPIPSDQAPDLALDLALALRRGLIEDEQGATP